MNKRTPEEEAEMKAYVSEYIRKSNSFWTGESKNCPTCGEPVTAATLYAKIEPEIFSLYVKPCNHRLGLWGGAPKWITDVEIVPSAYGDENYEDAEDDDSEVDE